VASFFCHAFAVTKQVRLERIVRREITPDSEGPEELGGPPGDWGTGRAQGPVKTLIPKPHGLGQDWLRAHAPASVTATWQREAPDA
jgi:hypothetical protein